VFPQALTDGCVKDEALYLRTANDLVWKLDASAIQDDVGGTPTDFIGRLQWPYLDYNTLGMNKMFVGLDLVGTGAVDVQIAYDETDITTFSDNAGFGTSQHVTAAYTVSGADTLPGTPIPIAVAAPSYSLILTFHGNQSWAFQLANVYVNDLRGAGGMLG
jgi:hypothetical protein